jgi:hypothetical protein
MPGEGSLAGSTAAAAAGRFPGDDADGQLEQDYQAHFGGLQRQQPYGPGCEGGFGGGRQIGGIQASVMGDSLAQLMVSTAHPGVPASTTSAIVERIVAVRKDLGTSGQRSGH